MTPIAAIRPLDAVQIEHEGRPAVLIRDLEGLCPNQMVVPWPMFLIMTLLDGQRDTAAVQAELTRLSGGQLVSTAQIDKAVEQLDQLFLLKNARADERREQLEAEFEALPARPASHAAQAYPGEEQACREAFDQYFEGVEQDPQAPAPVGLIVPHIDFRVGGGAIARGLAPCRQHPAGTLYVILGVAHNMTPNLFTLTGKSFQTPLGLVHTNAAAAGCLREVCGAQHLNGSLAHRLEHSVEFQAVGLQYLRGGREEQTFSILPLLCGSLQETLQNGASPMAQPEVALFVEGLRAVMDAHPGPVCLLASVDLSHVGRKFGDPEGISAERAEQVKLDDARMLERALAMDAEGFFDHFRADANARNVDAVTAVYVMLKALEGRASGKAQLLDYRQWIEEQTDSMVTFASAAYY